MSVAAYPGIRTDGESMLCISQVVPLPAMQDMAISFHVALQQGTPSIGRSGAESYIAAGRASARDDAAGFAPLGGTVAAVQGRQNLVGGEADVSG